MYGPGALTQARCTHPSQVQGPGAVAVVGDVHPGVAGDDVLLHSQDGGPVERDPRHQEGGGRRGGRWMGKEVRGGKSGRER